VAEPDLAAALAELAGHPYVVVPSPADAARTTRLAGPLPATEVLDLGFGAADALVEVHVRGLAVDGLHAGSLVTSASGEPRLAVDSVRPADAADQAADVAALCRALAGLLADDGDRATQSTRAVLTDGTRHTAAAVRDALAAVRLGTLPPRPPTPSPTDTVSTSGTGTEHAGGAIDPAQRLQGRPEPAGAASVPTTSVGGSMRWLVLTGVVLLVIAVVIWLLVR